MSIAAVESAQSRRHSLSTPAELCVRPLANVADGLQLDILACLAQGARCLGPSSRASLEAADQPSSPVDSVLSPDLRFPFPFHQGGGPPSDGGSAAAAAATGPRLRPRSKSAGGQPSHDASPSFEYVRCLRNLAVRGMGVPAAPPMLATMYCEFHDKLQGLRKKILINAAWNTNMAGAQVRELVGVARSVEIFLLAVLYPQSGHGPSLTPADYQHLASMVNAAAAPFERAHDVIFECNEQVAQARERLARLCKTWGYTFQGLPPQFKDRAIVRSILDTERILFRGLEEKQLPGLTEDMRGRVQDIRDFLGQKELYLDVEPVVHGALPQSTPEQTRRRQDGNPLGGGGTQQGVARDTRGSRHRPDATPRFHALWGPASTKRRPRMRWAYLKIRYGSRSRWRRIDHQSAREAFVAFQKELLAARAAVGEEGSSTEAVLLMHKAETWVRWHDEQLGRDRPRRLGREGATAEPETDEEEEEWARQLSRSLRATADGGPSGPPTTTTPSPSPAPDSKRDSGVGCATPTPVGATGSCVDLMERAGVATQSRRRNAKDGDASLSVNPPL